MARTNSNTLSIRAAAREYGFARATIAENLDEIPHRKLGRRVVILRAEFENWLRGNDAPDEHAASVVSARMAHRRARGGAP
jgi:hypothetical protein